MKYVFAAMTLMAWLLAGQAFAQSSSYTVSSTGPYATITNFTNCTTNPPYPCQNFTSGMGVSGSLTFSAPLTANLSNAEVGNLVTAYQFSSGLSTASNTDVNSRLNTLRVSTDGSGQITTINLMQTVQWLGAGSTSNRFNAIVVAGGNGTSTFNSGCQTQGTGNSGATDTCLLATTTDTSRSTANSAPVSLSLVVAAVPTLTEWAMILFGLILAGGAAVLIQRRRLIA